MNVHQIISDAMKEHKNKIEITQWAVISSIASLIFSEYISNSRQKQKPVHQVLVPSIKYVHELVDPASQFMTLMSEKLIDGVATNERFIKYANAPEFVIFNEENINTLKTIFDLYMIPNIERRLPETIMKKFGLDNEKQQLVFEDNTLDLFKRKPINEEQLDYIIEETVLQLLVLLPSMRKDIQIIENNKSFHLPLKDQFILTINNQSAICAVHYNDHIIKNKSVIDLLNFVTSTSFGTETQDGIMITTGVFNQACITMLRGIETE